MSTQVTINPFVSPTQIPGCQLWLDAADPNSLTLTGSNVTQWRDKSGNGNNSSVVGSITNSGKINSLAAMQYPGTAPNYFIGPVVNSGSTLTAFSVFVMNSSSYVVARILSLAKPGGFDYNTTLHTAAIQRNGTASFLSFRNNANLGAVTPVFGSPVQVCTLFDGVRNTFYSNGTQGTSVASSGDFGYTQYEIGGSFGEESLVPLNGLIGEVIVFHSALTTTQRQQVEGYLAWKWGLQANLPSNHPYKSSLIPPLLNPPTQLPVSLQNSAATFLPNTVPGCSLWLDAADASTVTTVATNVTNVRDKSGNNIVLSNATGFSYPNNTFNGGRYPSFYNALGRAQGGTARLGYNAAFAIPTPFTIFAVGIMSTSDFGFITDSAPSSSINREYIAGELLETQYGLATGTPGRNNFIISAQFIAGTATSITYLNGSPLYTGSLTTFTTGGITIGNRFTLNEAWPGHLCEILIYRNTPISEDRQRLEGYLAWKWGLQANLSRTHPYKAGPPYSMTITAPSRSLAIGNLWQPTQVSGLQLWLDAADRSSLILSGTTVTQWNDKSGNARNFSQGTLANCPSYTTYLSYPSIRFTGANSQSLSNNYIQTGNGGRHTYLVFVDISTSANIYGNPVMFFMADGNSTQGGDWRAAFDGANQYLSIDVSAGAKTMSTSPNVTSMRTQLTMGLWGMATGAKVSQSYVYGNGTAFNTQVIAFSQDPNINTQNNPPTRIGGGQTGYATFVLYEALHYNVELTTSQRQQVEGYLAWKWGLVSSLPSNHPYKKWPPSP